MLSPIDRPMLESSSLERDSGAGLRFLGLRGVRWRINLGILPGSPSASIDELRRVSADSRRRYASLRRRLLIDPHLPKDGSNSPDLTMDNPLSQNPDSMWGRYFRNAELDKMLDQDLSRLYPEHGSYFQTPACQAMLRRILLMWCLGHPECGYRQGMHELLAPLLYVLHIDVEHLSEVRKSYEDYFSDDFNEMSFPNGDLVTNYRFTRAANWVAGIENEDDVQVNKATPCCLDELDTETRDIFLLSDAYGAEGELGIVLSERFMEHDAYCMFNGLMTGGQGVVAMVDFFSPSPATGSSTGLPPVIEASSALHHLLSIVDSSLHSHLVELSVEPQYFALRWLRVLFGREFSLEDLLVIWDEIFLSPNGMVAENNSNYSFKVLCSPRGAFITALAVSMLLHLRSSVLATEYATSCLQKLLNFPENVDVQKLIKKAKTLQALALEANNSSPLDSSPIRNILAVGRGSSLPFGSVSPKASLSPLLDSYWEEKWHVLNREGALQKGGKSKSLSKGIIKGKLVQKLGLSRTESDPSSVNTVNGNNHVHSSVWCSLVDDFSQEINSVVDHKKVECDRDVNISASKESISVVQDEGKHFTREACCPNSLRDACLSVESSSVISNVTSHRCVNDDHETDSEKSSVTSNSFLPDNDETSQFGESCSNSVDDNLPSQEPEDFVTTSSCIKGGADTDKTENLSAHLKERKPLSGKFQWFWKFGKASGEGNSEKGANETQQPSIIGNMCEDISCSTSDGRSKPCEDSVRIEVADKNMISTLKNLGQSMLENIQVIELVFQPDQGQAGTLENKGNNILGSKGQGTAMAAIKELRKISNLLSEM